MLTLNLTNIHLDEVFESEAMFAYIMIQAAILTDILHLFFVMVLGQNVTKSLPYVVKK